MDLSKVPSFCEANESAEPLVHGEDVLVERQARKTSRLEQVVDGAEPVLDGHHLVLVEREVNFRNFRIPFLTDRVRVRNCPARVLSR